MKQFSMSSIFLACLLLALSSGAQAKEKQIKLEDIERDTLAAERRAKHQTQHSQLSNQYLPKASLYSHQHQQITATPTPPKMQYGFVPLKAPQQYVPSAYQQQQYQQLPHYQQQTQAVQQEYQYVTPSHTQAYLTVPNQQLQRPSHHQQVQHLRQYQTPQVSESQEYHQGQVQVQAQGGQGQGQGSLHTQAYIPANIQTQAYQQYIQQSPSHSQAQPQIQYVPAGQLQQYQYSNQGHIQPQIQYIVDNSIQQQPNEKYYQQPQYVYIQPYQTPSASNNIHSVADTKGNVQYVMYVPASAYPGETVLAYPTNQEQYVYQPTEAEAPKPEVKYAPQVTYADEEKPTYQQVQRPVFKHQPTSLLDSYVPSYLQYQYYKQQQDTANAIKQQSIKLTAGADLGKADLVKTNYKREPATSTYQRSSY